MVDAYMKIIQPKIKLTEEQYIKYCSGEYKLKGLLKDSNNNRIIKHLDVFQDKNQDDAKYFCIPAADFINSLAKAGFVCYNSCI